MDDRPEEWLVAIGNDRSRRYLIHTWHPVFMGEVMSASQATPGKFTFELTDGRVLSNILFWDDFPSEEEMAALLINALAAIEAFDGAGTCQ